MLYNTRAKQDQAPTVTGQNIAKAHRTVPERALLAADLYLERIRLVQPTIGQCCAILGICREYVRVAAAIAGDEKMRAAVIDDGIPLLKVVKPTNGNGHGENHGESLADHLARSTPEELANAARQVGVDFVWDQMIGPSI